MNYADIRERNVLLGIALSIVTFGLYMLYWIYRLHTELTALTSRRGAPSGVLVVVLCCVTLGIYQVYWAWQMGKTFQEEARLRGSNEADHCPNMYLILQLFNYLVGVASVFNLALMQDRLNVLLRMRGAGRYAYDPNRFNHVPEADIARRYEARDRAYQAKAGEKTASDHLSLPSQEHPAQALPAQDAEGPGAPSGRI